MTIVECDDRVQRIYPFRGQLETICGRGGTDLQRLITFDRPVVNVRYELDAASSTLDVAAPLWHRVAAPAVDTVRAVARAAGLSWRVTPAGAVWVGDETWPDAPDGDVTLLATDPRRGVYTVSGEVFAILPGALWIARDEAADTAVRVGDVRHEIDGQTVTTRITSAS